MRNSWGESSRWVILILHWESISKDERYLSSKKCDFILVLLDLMRVCFLLNKFVFYTWDSFSCMMSCLFWLDTSWKPNWTPHPPPLWIALGTFSYLVQYFNLVSHSPHMMQMLDDIQNLHGRLILICRYNRNILILCIYIYIFYMINLKNNEVRINWTFNILLIVQ